MKIKLVKNEMNVSDADAIIRIVNGELENKKWYIAIEHNMPRFYGNGRCGLWNIFWDKYDFAWKLEYDIDCVGVVEFEDDIDIMWNWN